MAFVVRRILPEDYEPIAEIARSLHPQWFTESALEEIARTVRTQDGFVAIEKKVVGFATYLQTAEDRTAELTWIAACPERHRRGVGRALVNAIEDELVRQKIQSLQVSTLAPTEEYKSYARTRSFYHAMGFSDTRIDKNWFPNWDDRLLLTKKMSLKRQTRLLVTYFSYTGDTRLIAEALAERLRTYDIETVKIVPTRKRSYLHWLAYSFVPNSEVDIANAEMDLSKYDAVLLGYPKWTFSCPPLNRFIHNMRNVDKPRFYLFMSCGGFDEQRFLENLTHKLIKKGCNVVECLTVKRKQIQRETYAESVDLFARRIRQDLD